MEELEVTILILRYIVNHPNASDTIEGITEWWITREVIALNRERVHSILRQLTGSGFLLERTLGNSGERLYSVNSVRIAELQIHLKNIEEGNMRLLHSLLGC